VPALSVRANRQLLSAIRRRGRGAALMAAWSPAAYSFAWTRTASWNARCCRARMMMIARSVR